MAPTDPGSPRRAAVVYNPVKVDIDELKASVSLAEAESGWGESMWFETTEKDPGGGQTLEALEQGADVVMAAGGDGTVRAVAESLRGSGIPIGLLPSGTGNLLARNLNLTLTDIPDSIITALTGQDRPIDLGVLEARHEDGSKTSRVFLVMAGLGLDAKMIVNTDDDLKKRVGWVAYVDAIRKSLRDTNRLRIRYRLDDEPQRVLTAHTVLIGNCGSLPANILLLPEASVDDGLFDIIALRPEGLIGWVQVWIKIVWENGVLRRTQAGRKLMGDHKPVRALRYLKGKRIVLRLERPQEFELDGDAFGMAIAIKATVDPGALIVRIPKGVELE